jgi:hypothetical protein
MWPRPSCNQHIVSCDGQSGYPKLIGLCKENHDLIYTKSVVGKFLYTNFGGFPAGFGFAPAFFMVFTHSRMSANCDLSDCSRRFTIPEYTSSQYRPAAGELTKVTAPHSRLVPALSSTALSSGNHQIEDRRPALGRYTMMTPFFSSACSILINVGLVGASPFHCS